VVHLSRSRWQSTQTTQCFVDYLHVWAQEEHDESAFRFGFKAHRDQVRKGLEDSPITVTAQYEWLAGYHNWTAEALAGLGASRSEIGPLAKFRRF